MGAKLLVRSYNVGCGDCIYVRIPDPNRDDFHILIDCGSKEGASTGVMKRAIKHIEDNMLPDENSKKRLDLIVVTHRHEDHIKGFNPSFFKNMVIKNIWLTGAMNEDHPQAKNTRALHQHATNQMRALARSRVALSPELRDLVALYGVRNDKATTALTETLPKNNDIKPTFVFAGQDSDDHGISVPNTKIYVLAPEHDIDGFYLGEETVRSISAMSPGGTTAPRTQRKESKKSPKNISTAEFRNLQTRMLSNALAFAVDDSSIQNNVSTVLLIEWGKRRLLFVGDAEWKSEFKRGKKNGSWNVMWHERKALLDKPIDFLKVGHHGSQNATPWNRHADDQHEVNQILNAILPLPAGRKKPTAQCIVSTKRKQYDTIPDGELLVELGRRLASRKNYLKAFKKQRGFDPESEIFNYSKMKEYSSQPSPREVGDKGWLNKPQPLRTDMESEGKGSKNMIGKVEFIDVEIDA